MNKYKIEVYNKKNNIISSFDVVIDKNAEEVAILFRKLLKGNGWAYIQPLS